MKVSDLKCLIKEIVDDQFGDSHQVDKSSKSAEVKELHKKKLLDHLDSFTHSYLEAALNYSTDSHEDTLSENFDFIDFDLDTLENAIRECRKFQNENLKKFRKGGWSYNLAGHDFFLTRNGHGTGFWDRTESEGFDENIGDLMADKSKDFGEIWFDVGEGDLIYSYK